jgi:hypothetical protein
MDNPRAPRRVQPGVRIGLALAALLLSACLTNRIGPGVLRQDWNQRPRDPTANPIEQYPDDRWSDERPSRIPGPGEAQPPPLGEGDEEAGEGDSTAVDLAKRSIATALAGLAGRNHMSGGLAGWLPLIESSGTFEEDPTTRALHEQRRDRAERRRAEKKQRRVERPGPDDR